MFSGFDLIFIFSRALFCVKTHSTLLHIFVLSCTELHYSCRLHVCVGSVVYPRNDRPEFVPFRLAYEFTQIIRGKKSFIRICVRTFFFFL